MIVNASDHGVAIALLEDKKLVELHNEENNTAFSVGDLYLGKVKKLMPDLNAAFVDVGYEKDAFLHYTDLSPYFKSLLKFTRMSRAGNNTEGIDFSKFELEPEILKTGKITEVLQQKPEILVQILKEPISTKGPRLSCEISLPGRFVVLTPFNNFVSISRKIHSSDERKRLQKIVESIKPHNFGVIVRTAAEGKNTAELHTDLLDLENSWKAIEENLSRCGAPPQRLLTETAKTNSILRDLLNDSFSKIIVNDPGILRETKEYISRIAPEKESIVQLYESEMPVFDYFGITKQIKASFGRTVNMHSGAYLIVERTEAMHVVDVNSGTRSSDGGQEGNALKTNMEAAAEIARQMRLRDLGGIIIVDFIDMKLPDHRKELYEAMTKFMENDRARHTILPITKFGLMQITRQRLKPELTINTTEVCPTCHGSGKVGPTLLITDEIENDLEYLVNQGHKNLGLVCHPMLRAYIRDKGLFRSFQWQWYRKYNIWLQLKEDSNMGLIQYQFLDKRTDELIKF